MALLVKSVNPTASLGDEALGCRGEECRASRPETSRVVPVPTLAKVYEDRAEDYTRAAEGTDDPVFRKMLLMLALQWRLAEPRSSPRSDPNGATP
jgi:hypothetical protein